jgi:Tfp pilus assembly protein PilF
MTSSQEWLRRGEVLSIEGRFAQARDAFREALVAANGTLSSIEQVRCLWRLADARRELADYDAALAAGDDALRAADRVGGDDARRERVRALTMRGRILTDAGNLAEAEAPLQEALAGSDPDVEVEGALALRALGDLRAMQARYAEVEQAYSRANATLQRLLPAEDRDRLRTLNSLGLASMYLNRLEEAETRLRRALELRRQALAPEHPDIGESFHNVATVVQRRGRLDESESLERSAAAIWTASLGPQHPRLALALGNLGAICQKRGRLDEAEKLYRQGLAIREASLGPQHPRLIVSINNLASVAFRLGRLEEAERLFRRSLALATATKGEQHPDVARALNNLYSVLNASGKTEEGEAALRRAIAIWEGGEESKDLAVALSNLATLQMARGEDEPAEDALLRALAIQERILGAQHPDLAPTINNLATLFAKTGKLEAAESMYLRALALRKKVGYAPSPETLANLAEIARRQGRSADQRRWLEEAVHAAEATGGKAAPALVRCLHQLGVCLRGLGENRLAADVLERSVAIQQRAAGSDTTELAVTSVAWAGALLALGKNAAAEQAYRQAIELLEPLAVDRPNLLAETLVLLGAMLVRTGREADAAPLLRRGQELASDGSSAARRIAAHASLWQGYAAIARGDLDAAERLLLAALDEGDGDTFAEKSRENLALFGLRRVYGEAGRPVLKAGVLEQLIERRSAQGVADAQQVGLIWELAQLFLADSRFMDAARLYQRIQQADGGAQSAALRGWTAYCLGLCLWRLGNHAGAAEQLARAETCFIEVAGPDTPGRLRCRATWMDVLAGSRSPAEALALAPETERLAGLDSMPPLEAGNGYRALGNAYLICRWWDAAESAFRKAIETWESCPDDEAGFLIAVVRKQLASLEELRTVATGDLTEAIVLPRLDV